MGGFNHFFRTATAINRNHHQTSGYVHDYSELSYIQTQSHYGNHEVPMNPDSGSHPLVPNEVGVSKFHSVFPASVPPPLPKTRNGWGFFFLVGTLPQMHIGGGLHLDFLPPSLAPSASQRSLFMLRCLYVLFLLTFAPLSLHFVSPPLPSGFFHTASLMLHLPSLLCSVASAMQHLPLYAASPPPFSKCERGGPFPCLPLSIDTIHCNTVNNKYRLWDRVHLSSLHLASERLSIEIPLVII